MQYLQCLAYTSYSIAVSVELLVEVSRMNTHPVRLVTGGELAPLSIAPIAPTLWDTDNEETESEAKEVREYLVSRLRARPIPLDQWPYSREFDEFKADFVRQFDINQALSIIPHDNLPHGLWKLCLRIRKAGASTHFTTRESHSQNNCAPIEYQDRAISTNRILDSIAVKPSMRDSLPYSDAFEPSLRNYNSMIRGTKYCKLNNREFWRAIVSIAKKSRRYDPFTPPLFLED